MKCSDHSPLRRNRLAAAFTLIELLVVVAIILLLAALLLPSLKEARERGRRAVCASNLRQIAIASVNYTDDYNGRFPSLSSPAAEPWRWAGNLLYNIDLPNRPLNKYLGITKVTTYINASSVSPNISSAVRCPSDRMDWTPGSGTHYSTLGSSYFFNVYGRGTPTINGLKGAALSDVGKPSLVLLAMDWTYDVSYAMASFGNIYFKGPHWIGTTWGHGVFVDSHVRWIHFSENASSYWQGDGWSVELQ